MNRLYLILFFLLWNVFFNPIKAETYLLDNEDDMLIGEIEVVAAKKEDTLLDIARESGFGYLDIKLVNPDVDTWLPGEGKQVTLPSQFILPEAQKKGIVLNVPEMRLYYYPPFRKGKARKVHTYPIGIGREGWATPYIKTNIVEKKRNPNWYPTKSIIKEYEENGEILPSVVKAGEDNPLGQYAMRLGRRDYLIHGTNKPYGVGMRVSHGCVRLYPEDIEELFNKVSLKTPVNIVNQPYKIGVRDDVIYLEAHPYLKEDVKNYENNLTSVVRSITKHANNRKYKIDWASAYEAIRAPTGVPIAIGNYINDKVRKKISEN